MVEPDLSGTFERGFGDGKGICQLQSICFHEEAREFRKVAIVAALIRTKN